MSTLEDKILGEKNHNYCSSSEEDSGDEDYSDCYTETSQEKSASTSESLPLPETNKWRGTSTNTGPKGVVTDWQCFKKLENQKRTEQELEKIELAKKLTLTVQSALDEEREKAAQEDPELAELLGDTFLINYQKQRMQEMLLQNNTNIKFGKLIYLKNGQEYLDAIDKENKTVKVIIHIYEDNVRACRCMNACLGNLSETYENVKFCAIIGSTAGMSTAFKVKGVPALLIYKGGQLIGNFVGLADDLGNDFCPEDIQGYLVEHGMLEDKTCVPFLIGSSAN